MPSVNSVCALSTGWKNLQREDACLNGFSPAAPQPAFYDVELDGWVLSRYADVLAALHETRLYPVDSRAPDVPQPAELDVQRRLRTETLAALSRQKIDLWRKPFAELAHSLFVSMRPGNRVELIREFAEPWSLGVALSVIEADKRDAARLNSLARKVSIASADPLNQELRDSAKAANLELAASLQSSPVPMSGPAFVALSQTLPRFLAKAWLALLHHPLQLERLRGQPELMFSAVEELLRYAGVAQTVFRRASTTFHLAGVTIARGARVALRLSSANWDPLPFPEPHALDFSRPLSPHFALGTGSHSCAGGLLMRTLSAIATAEFVQNVSALDTSTPIEWLGGFGSCTPKYLYVFMRQDN